MAHAEKLLSVKNLWEPSNMDVLHHVNQGLRAHTLFKLDVDYMVKDGQVVIVDEFTGRLMPGRRWSDGLHQAVEAKEKVKIERENQTLATITFQNYFRKYKKLSGMTGTADTEAEEFAKIYKLDVIVIPPNRKLLRVENPDLVYRTEKEKWDAIGKVPRERIHDLERDLDLAEGRRHLEARDPVLDLRDGLARDREHRVAELVEHLFRLGLRWLDHQRLGDDEREVDRRRMEAVVHQPFRDVERARAVLALEASR